MLFHDIKFIPVNSMIDNRTCIQILHRQKVPIHIIRHCAVVARVGCKLADNLRSKGKIIDIDIVRAGGLLHDIAKMQAIENGGDHAEIGARFLESLGYYRVAEIVRQHVFLKEPVKPASSLSEELVVNYADKRVMHTKVVSLDERFQDLFKRYGKNRLAIEKIEELYKQARIMEQLIFSRMAIKPEDIQYP